MLDSKVFENNIKPDIIFHHITQKEGLSYNLVNSFLKDRKGMLWIGTYNGLNKYDGAHFYTYHSGYGKNTLPNNSVHDLAEDKLGNIWGATDNGVFCFNPQTRNFKNYQLPKNLGSVTTQSILCDKNGVIWAANHHHLYYFNVKIDSFQIALANGNSMNFRTRKNCLVGSPDGKNIYLATKQGLVYYDKVASQYGFVAENCDNSSPSHQGGAAALRETTFGHYWYADNDANKIIAFDPYTKKIKNSIFIKELQKMGDVATVFEDNDHMLWISTWSYELLKVDYCNGNIVTRIGHNKNDASTIAGDFFWDAMNEEDGTLWLGTVGGISKCNVSRSFYKVHTISFPPNHDLNHIVNFVTENPLDKTWWVGNSDKLLANYSPITSKTIIYNVDKFIPNNENKTPSKINKMIFLKDTMLIFSQDGAWISEKGNKFYPLKLPKPFHNWRLMDATLYKNRIVHCISDDKLLRWDLQSGKIDSLVFDFPFITEGNPYFLAEPQTDKNGKVWILNGWNWLTYTDGKSLTPIKMTYQDSTEAEDGYFTSMIIDKKGDLWMTKKGDGLIYYNPTKNISKQYKQVDGLVMDHIMALAHDDDNKIWSACFNQFSIYNPSLNSFYNFTLPISANNNGYINFMAALHNGNIISSVASDVVEFYPKNIKPPLVTYKPLISMIAVNGKVVDFSGTHKLELESNENSLRLKFGLLTDNLFAPYQMLYKLEGADDGWSTATLNFEANYNSLSSGTYVFKVKAVAKDKSWHTDETILTIHIATPFFKTWWFFILSVLGTLTVFTIFYRMRMKQKDKFMMLESKAQLLEKEKTVVMYENLKQHLNPHFLFNSLTSLSSLIRIDQRQAGEFLDKMSKVYRYILKNKENETVALQEELKFVDLYIQLQKTRFGDGLQIKINIPDEFYYRKIAPVTLQNLVENAIKHNIADDETPLNIQMYIEDDYLVVQNNFQTKGFVETSNKQGQNSMISLYKYLSNRPVIITQTEEFYTVKIPLI